MLLFLLQNADPSLMVELFERYGVLGLAFGILLLLILRQNKAAQTRIENLEKQQQLQHEQHLADQKAMINDYVELVKNKTRVLADLTGCLKAIKDTLERMERK